MGHFAFVKDIRIARLVLRPHPLGTEIVCSIDGGGLLWSRTCRSEAELVAEMSRITADFEQRGWQAVEPQPSPAE